MRVDSERHNLLSYNSRNAYTLKKKRVLKLYTIRNILSKFQEVFLHYLSEFSKNKFTNRLFFTDRRPLKKTTATSHRASSRAKFQTEVGYDMSEIGYLYHKKFSMMNLNIRLFTENAGK